MHTVVIASDARFRLDERTRTFVEVCPRCQVERAPADATECRCGTPFPVRKAGFFTLQWTPPGIDVRFPGKCPHCLGNPVRTRRFTTARHTSTQRATQLGVDVPVCSRVKAPWLVWLGVVTLAFFFVVALLALIASMVGKPQLSAVLLSPLIGAALIALVRAYTWFRFATFDHCSYTFKVRRREYAIELAQLNGGRVGRPGRPID